MYLIVGLGNPGSEYINTRHNMGFMSLDNIALRHGVKFTYKKFDGTCAEYNYKGEKVLLLKPLKYINLSGEVIKKYLDYFKIPLSNLLIISDDLDMPFGKIKLKYKGSSGGHNGLKNIEREIGTNEYQRIKLGIGNDKLRDTKAYVLATVPVNERETLDCVINTVNNIFDDFFELSFENLMNKYNTK